MGVVELDSDDVMAEMLYLRTQKILKQVVHPPPLSKGLFIAIHSECGGPLPFAMRQALYLLVALARCSAGWMGVGGCVLLLSIGRTVDKSLLDNTTHLFTNAMPDSPHRESVVSSFSRVLYTTTPQTDRSHKKRLPVCCCVIVCRSPAARPSRR